MSIIVVGLNHKSAPIEVREKLAFNPNSINTALSLFSQKYQDQNAEIVILSTCNRVELYISSQDGAIKVEDVFSFLADFHKIELTAFSSYMYHYNDDRAVNHLFFVTSSLDSMVLGESQILSQVKEAYTMAAMEEATGKFLNQLFQQALNVAKILHTRTSIGKRKVSISSVAVEFAEKIFQDFTGKIVLVVGAGEMCELLLKHLYEEGARTFVLANRTFERAQELAIEYHGQAIKYELLGEHLEKADIVISSTSAPHYVIHADQVKEAIRHRRGNPMFLIDIAVPRNIEPEIANIDNFFLSRRRHTRLVSDWSSDVCSSDLRASKLFQAEDVRDWSVTGVQTCALPIKKEENTSELQSQWRRARNNERKRKRNSSAA